MSGTNFVLDPVLPKSLNNLSFVYKISNKCVKIIYKNTGEEKVIINGQSVPYEKEIKAYRKGGYIIDTKYILEDNVIEVYF